MNQVLRQISQKNGVDIVPALEAYRPQLEKVLPSHISADRLIRLAVTCYRMTPALTQCDRTSLFGAVMQCAQLGLEPGVLGEAYIVPFKGRAQLIPGYQGLVKLAYQSGEVRSIWAYSVRERDTFEVELGTEQKVRHIPLKRPNGFPAPDEERGEIVGVYAGAELVTGGKVVTMMTIEEIQRVRSRSAAGNAGPWVTDFEQMALKTVIRRLFKWLPRSIQVRTALALSDMADRGIDQRLSIETSFENLVDEGDNQ